jgi:hypothetical protein
MKPHINNTTFGSITIEAEKIDHDVFITLKGEVKKRKKKLSKAVYGTSHTVSLDEVKHVYETGAEQIVIGTGQYGALKLSDEAAEYLEKKKCKATLLPTPEAIKAWNETEGATIGLFHITC